MCIFSRADHHYTCFTPLVLSSSGLDSDSEGRQLHCFVFPKEEGGDYWVQVLLFTSQGDIDVDEGDNISILAYFILGYLNVIVDYLSRRGEIPSNY